MGQPNKKYLKYFKKYRNDPEKEFYSLFGNMKEYNNFVSKPGANYHTIMKPCPYIDCPWCQKDLK